MKRKTTRRKRLVVSMHLKTDLKLIKIRKHFGKSSYQAENQHLLKPCKQVESAVLQNEALILKIHAMQGVNMVAE
jgi:hypothetical protein